MAVSEVLAADGMHWLHKPGQTLRRFSVKISYDFIFDSVYTNQCRCQCRSLPQIQQKKSTDPSPVPVSLSASYNHHRAAVINPLRPCIISLSYRPVMRPLIKMAGWPAVPDAFVMRPVGSVVMVFFRSMAMSVAPAMPPLNRGSLVIGQGKNKDK